MKRLAIVIVALSIALLGAVALAPLLLPTEIIRERLIEQVEAWLGRPVTALRDPTIAIYPRPTVRIEGVSIGNSDGTAVPFMTVEVVSGTARLLPLLVGRVEIREFKLEGPRLALRVDEDGRANWAFPGGTVGARVADAVHPDIEPSPESAPDVVLGRFVIENGTVTYQVGDGPVAAITDVALDIAWPSTAAEAEATGSLTFRGERIAIEAALDSPLDLIARRRSAGRFSISGSPVSIDFDGVVSRDGVDFSFLGETAIVVASLRRLLAWSGADILDGQTLGPASIRGEASWQWPVLAFSGATMSLDGNVADGAFTVDFSDRRPAIRGTIAADALDLSSYVAAFQADVQADGAWTNASIELPVLALIDWDVRISAASVTINGVRAEGVGASVVVDDGAILLSIGEATAYGGQMQAFVAGQLDAPHLSIEGQVSIAGVDVGSAAAAVLDATSVTGTVTASLDVAGAGTNWGELIGNLSGTIRLRIANGSIRGIDLEAAAQLEVPTVDALTAGSGPTEFSLLTAVLRLREGRVDTDEFVATGLGFDLAFAGFASLMRPTIGGEGIIRFHLPPAGRSLPFEVAGTWSQPLLLADPDPMPDPFAPAGGILVP